MVDYATLAQPFITPEVRAVLLVGSHARGDAGEYSDIDLKLIAGVGVEPHVPVTHPATHLIDELLVTISHATPAEVEEWFTDPAASVAAIQGLRDARVLYDPDGIGADIQRRAHAFIWDATVQAKANAWVSAEMVSWIEEVYKGLEGLRRGDIGRMLNARHGFSWGLSRVVQVYVGVLFSSDNGIHAELTGHVSAKWAALRDAAFGIRKPDGTPISLEEQIISGLELYVETARMVDPAIILPEHRTLVDHTLAAITSEIKALKIVPSLQEPKWYRLRCELFALGLRNAANPPITRFFLLQFGCMSIYRRGLGRHDVSRLILVDLLFQIHGSDV